MIGDSRDGSGEQRMKARQRKSGRLKRVSKKEQKGQEKERLDSKLAEQGIAR
jgi:hypothetical protein